MTTAIWALVGMTALAKGVTGLVTGRTSAALRGDQEAKASTSIATRGSRGQDADMQRNKVIAGTMAAREGNRVATMMVVDQGHAAAQQWRQQNTRAHPAQQRPAGSGKVG